jgi:hypothetical protein
MTMDYKRVRVARPTEENRLAQGVVGMALPAVGNGTVGLFYLIPYYAGDMDTVEGLLFSEAELEPLP